MKKSLSAVLNLPARKQAKSTLKLADAAIKLGLAPLPGLGEAYEISKAGLEWCRDYVQARNEQRVSDFYRVLLSKSELSEEDCSSAELEEANFHALLGSCVTDIEDEKTVPYALMTRSMWLGKIPVKHKRYFIHLLKGIEYDHLDLIREAYVLTKYSCISPSNKPIRSRDFLAAPDGLMNALAIQDLTSKGVFSTYKLTPMGLNFVESCSLDEDLTPIPYEYKRHRAETAVVAIRHSTDGLGLFAEELINALRLRGVQAEVNEGFDMSDAHTKFSDYLYYVDLTPGDIPQEIDAALNLASETKNVTRHFIFKNEFLARFRSGISLSPQQGELAKKELEKYASEIIDSSLNIN